MSHSWVWLMSVLLFFCNTIPFAGSLSLSLLLTPAWLYLIASWKLEFSAWLRPLTVLLAVYAGVHWYHGVEGTYYVVSSLIILATLLFGIIAWYSFRRYGDSLDTIFRHLLILNFVFTLFSICLLFVPALKPLVWYTMSVSQDIEPFPRLKLLASEASHYSYLLAPLIIYFLSRILFCRVSQPGTTLLFMLLPLALSFSLGVILCLTITGSLVFLIYFRRIMQDAGRWRNLLLLAVIALVVFLALYYWFPDNPLYKRIANIIDGKDTSTRGRTYESFILAHKITALKSQLFGIGPGQLKVLGKTLIIQYYQYTRMPEVVRIPNAAAETIVCYGYLGLAIRLLAQGFLFFCTRVYLNPFRVWLFLFLFLFQFTGSYINNPAEYLLWALVFAPVFPDLDRQTMIVKHKGR